jgi:phosphoribosylaminoimidazole carboxylase PurE protein
MSEVVIVLGSASDGKAVKDAGVIATLDALDITHTVAVVSPHCNSAELLQYVTEQVSAGAKVFIGVADMAAVLPGALAGATSMTVPIIAVPLDEHGIDASLYMPPGVPVLLAGVGKAGLKNASMAAGQILAVNDRAASLALKAYVSRTNKTPQFDIKLEDIV